MKLASFRVRRYKNVLDSTEVSVESDVTTLVGMNESGKSTMLDALYRLIRSTAIRSWSGTTTRAGGGSATAGRKTSPWFRPSKRPSGLTKMTSKRSVTH